MSSIGNDNYRPQLKPLEPYRQKSGWLSSNMAQLMVFLNGLILTITAFATLSVFIDEIVKEGLIKTTEEVETQMLINYSSVERGLNSLSSIIEMNGQRAIEPLKAYANKEVAGLSYFSEIYWVSQNKEGAWSIVSLLPKSDYLQLQSSSKGFVEYVRLNGEKADDIKMVNSLNISDETQKAKYNDSFGLIKTYTDSNKRLGYLLGITSLEKVVSPQWLSDKESIYNFQVTDTRRNELLYFYQRPTARKESPAAKFLNIFHGNISNVPVDIKVELGITSRESFLQKIPLLMLLFGITLTLIGTLYVRNNQSQSKKLANMNKELAHKNFELNQEISERERLNQVIQNSAREHRAIINAVSDIIFEVSLDGKILFLNEAWNKVTEFELERSIGRNLFDLIYTQDQDEQRHNFTLLTQGKKKSYRVFTRLRSADGSFRAIELAVSMLRQGDNQDMRVVGTITDVEERRRAERALSEAEKKYRAIVENAAGGIYQVTPEGQFLSANPALAKIIGYDSPEEVLRDVESAQDQLYVDKEGRAKFLSDISVLDISKNYEGQIKRKDGQIIWVSENIRPVKDDEGTLLFFEGSMEDVDQRRKAELALKDAKIESDLANRAKSEFLANMSHELRTPLNAVIGFSEIIKNESFGPLPSEEYKDYANSIYDSGQNLLNVINDILDVSRIEAGDRTLNEGVVKVSEIVDSCLSLMDTKIKNNKIQLQNKVAQSDLSFIGEKHAVKQMLLNLISNAVKFSPENSLIMLDAELDSKSRLRLSVTDTGIGMNEYELKKALSPFGQIDTEHNRSKSGTGLGLTLVKSLMELHGGEFEIVSQKGIGTTATLIFPTKRVARAKPQAAKNPEDSYDDFADITEMKDA